MKRVCMMLLLAAGVVWPQSLSFGVKGGVPFSDSLKVTNRETYFSDKSPYVIGPALELNLAAGVSVEGDLLFRRVKYGSSSSRTKGEAWEVPLLAKFRPAASLLQPFVLAGMSFRRLARFEQRTSEAGSTTPIQITDQPAEVRGRFTAGPTVGAGLEARLPLFRLSAELRYTRWGSSSFRSPLGGMVTQLNQADLLLGIMF